VHAIAHVTAPPNVRRYLARPTLNPTGNRTGAPCDEPPLPLDDGNDIGYIDHHLQYLGSRIRVILTA